jgi:hypothetical protein
MSSPAKNESPSGSSTQAASTPSPLTVEATSSTDSCQSWKTSITTVTKAQAAAQFKADKPRPYIPDKPNDKPDKPDKHKAKPKDRTEAAPSPLPTKHTRRPRPTRRNDGVTRRADSCTPYSNYIRHRVRRNWRAWNDIGVSGQVLLKWIWEGVTIPFLNNRPPTPFNQGVSLPDATPKQLTFVEAELARFVETGAREPTTCIKYVFKLFLVAKPGNNQWRLIVDLLILIG